MKSALIIFGAGCLLFFGLLVSFRMWENHRVKKKTKKEQGYGPIQR